MSWLFCHGTCFGVAAHGWNVDYLAGLVVGLLVLSDSSGVERGFMVGVGLGTLLGPEGVGLDPGVVADDCECLWWWLGFWTSFCAGSRFRHTAFCLVGVGVGCGWGSVRCLRTV